MVAVEGGVRITAPTTLVMVHSREGRPEKKMIGMVVEHSSRGLVLFHAHSGSQPFRDYKTGTVCPCPLDLRMITTCALSGIGTAYVYDRKRREMLRVEIDTLKDAPIHDYGLRCRVYAPQGMWTVLEGVREARSGPRVNYLKDGALILSAPNGRDLPEIDLTERTF